jgi:two-component system, OmpR family, response regulator
MVRLMVVDGHGGMPPSNVRVPDDEHGDRPLLHIVEDDGSTLVLLQEIARDSGWAVAGFTRLGEFRRAVERVTPDLIILDDDLPDGRGGDFARELRADERMRHVPLVVCTAAHPMRQAEIGSWAPVIPKPFDLTQIDELLQAAAGRRSGDRGQAAG